MMTNELQNCALYMDGFNFFHGAPLRADGKKEGLWLNPVALAREVWPEARIQFAKYFSARLALNAVNHARGNLSAPEHQRLHWRALRTLPNLEIVEGHYDARTVSMPLAANPARDIRVVRVEEKRSDVNLASHLLWDAARGAFDCALVASNDSDLREALRLTANEFGRRVILMPPPRNARPARLLREILQDSNRDFRRVPTVAIQRAQFPNRMRDANGIFSKPKNW